MGRRKYYRQTSKVVMHDKVKILGTFIFNGDTKQAVDTVVEELKRDKKESWCISLTGAHGLVIAHKDEEFNELLKSFYMNLPDGVPGVWIGRLKGHNKIKRCYGPDLFRELMFATANMNLNHYLCGGAAGVAEDLKQVCIDEFNNKHIVGTYTPPFTEMSDVEVVELANDVNVKNTNIVWIGISTPKQEFLASRLSEYIKVNFIITVGAAFDFHTKRITQAPEMIQNLGLEWLFRLLVEPRRLWRRYIKVVPLFIFYNIREFVTGKFFK